MTGKEKSKKCDELEGFLHKGVCYTIKGTIDTYGDQVDVPELDCPGGCGIWGKTCAPETWHVSC